MNILLLTSVYRDDSIAGLDTSTNVVNSFAKEWVRQGHNVIVIHNSHRYPYLVHSIPAFLKKRIESKLGFSILPYSAVKKRVYCDNGVKIYRFPIFKYLPHRSPDKKRILKQINIIKRILENEEFLPDVITGHWASPQMEIVSELKREFACKTAIVLHGTSYICDYDFHAENYLPYIDNIGVRSLSQVNYVKDVLKLSYYPFICFSGIPDNYVNSYILNYEKFKSIPKWKIIYVGRLVEYKKVDSIICALSTFNNVNWELNVYGEGGEREKLELLADKLKCRDKVIFHGKVTRDEVMQALNDSHIFIMISRSEVFGLVYLEAMAASCITVASRNGGIDGIIIDSKNGFLCEQGNETELKDVLCNIFSLTQNTLTDIVSTAYKTAVEHSDSKMAELYLDNIK